MTVCGVVCVGVVCVCVCVVRARMCVCRMWYLTIYIGYVLCIIKQYKTHAIIAQRHDLMLVQYNDHNYVWYGDERCNHGIFTKYTSYANSFVG